MRFIVVFAACAVLASVSGSELARERKFIDSIANFFHHAVNTVVDKVEQAANTVKNGVVDAANTVKNGVVDAANTVADKAQTAFHTVEGAVDGAVDTVENKVTGAAHSAVQALEHVANNAALSLGEKIGLATQSAANLLKPYIMQQMQSVVTPAFQDLLSSTVDQLVKEAPSLLQTLGQQGLEQLATQVIQSNSNVVGKRNANSGDQLKHLFEALVQKEINTTVNKVQGASHVLNKFNAQLKKAVAELEESLKTDGVNAEQAANEFISKVLTGLVPLTKNNALDVDVNDLDKAIPNVLASFEQILKNIHSESHKRSILSNLAQMAEQGENQISGFVQLIKSLAGGLLSPTIDNVKSIAQSVLTNAGRMTSGLMEQAMRLLAPFQTQLGPLFSQIQTLAHTLGVNTDVLIG